MLRADCDIVRIGNMDCDEDGKQVSEKLWDMSLEKSEKD